MKLYNSDISPFAGRVRMYIRHKGLPVEVCEPPIPLGTPEYRAAFPLGKVPVLVLDDGEQIAESAVIMRYLEEQFPEPAMDGDSPLARARVGMLNDFCDKHLGPALFPLFDPPAEGASSPAGDGLDPIRDELGKFDKLLVSIGASKSDPLTIADCSLATLFLYLNMLINMRGAEGLLGEYDAVQAWWQRVSGVEAVSAELATMSAAAQAYFAGDHG